MTTGWAYFSDDKKYRYRLGRRISNSPRRLLFIMLNPSLADAVQPDRTITRCTNFARAWGYGIMEVVNLFAYITPYPDHLIKAPHPGAGAHNRKHIKSAIETADTIILAWGSRVLSTPAFKRQARQITKIAHHLAPLHHLGLTQRGEPRHPLYLPKTTHPQPWLTSDINIYIQSHT